MTSPPVAPLELVAQPKLTEKARARADVLQIPSLDGLRAVSFMIVFLSHAGLNVMPGGFGVTVFFFLSGYLITTLMRREMEQTGTVSLKLFYQRRALRILPPFYLVLVVATVLSALGLFPDKLSAGAVAAQFLHYCNYWFAAHGFSGIAPGTGVYWSLAIEEHFYLLFPMLYLVLHRSGVRSKAMAQTFWALCAIVLAWRCLLVFHWHVPFYRVFVSSDTRADSMLFGCALAVFHNPALDQTERPLSGLWGKLWLPLAIVVLAVTFAVRSSDFRESFRYTLQGIALYPIFITAVRNPQWPIYRVLNLPWVRQVGALSYSLYLVHHTVIDALYYRFPGINLAVAILTSLLISLALSQAIFQWIEKPCAKLRRRLQQH